jgi:hypothetical protein
MSNESDPLVPRHARHRSDRLAPLPARLNPPARHQPGQLPARPYSASTQSSVRQPPPAARRRWPLVFRVLLWCGIIGLSGISVLGGLVLAGQTELVAWIIVGAVLSIVFGTPLLCVVGLFLFYVWAVTRMGRSRQRSPSTKTGGAQQVAQTIVVGEVVLD